MKLKHVFSPAFFLSLTLAARAQQGPALPRAGSPTSVPVIRPPDPVGPEPANISYNINMPVDEVLEIYAQLIGRTPLHTATGPMAVNGTTPITLKTQSPLTRSEAIQALETILGMNGITVVPDGDKFFKVVSDGSAFTAAGTFSTNTASSLPDSGRLITEIVQVKYADPTQVVAALQNFAKAPGNSIIYIPSTQSLILRDYTENVKRMLEMLERIDITSPLIIKPEVIPIKYALASDIASALSQLGAGGGTSVGRSTSGANFQTSTGSTTGVGGAPGATPYGSSTQNGASTGAAGQRSNFGQRLAQAVNGAGGGAAGGAISLFGATKIIADERTNSLLVFANDEDMKTIKDIIKKLDVVLAQVLIEAIILEVNLSHTSSTGISILQQQQTVHNITGAGGVNNLSSGASSFLQGGSASGTNSTGGVSTAIGSSVLSQLPGGFSYFAKYGNDLDAVLEAVAGDSRVSVLSRPRIQTSHAVEADLFIGNTVPYVTGTQNYGYSSGPSSTYTQLEVGIRLKVLPLINPEGLVVMDIDQEIEQLGPSVAIPGAGNVPTTTKRDVGAKVAVKSGETILLGGFISSSRSKTDAGVPWFMNIPVLGNLFKSSATDNERTELIVLMRPTVLPTPEIAYRVAMSERDKMPLVRKAELDIRKDEEANNIAAQKMIDDEAKRRAKLAAKLGTNAPADLDDKIDINFTIPSAPTNEVTITNYVTVTNMVPATTNQTGIPIRNRTTK
jgi:general secretion pathway protein D